MYLGQGGEIFDVISIQNQKVGIFEWDWWKLILLFIFYAIGAGIMTCGQVMIIVYIKKFAPKVRPINRMILIDQVQTYEIVFPYKICLSFCLSIQMYVR